MAKDIDWIALEAAAKALGISGPALYSILAVARYRWIVEDTIKYGNRVHGEVRRICGPFVADAYLPKSI